MSWKPEVIADDSGKWCGNMLRFATREEAEANVRDLARKWSLVQEVRTVETDDPVTHAYVHGRTVMLVVYGIRALGFADNTACPHAGQWLKSFDHDHEDGRGYGEFTRTPEKAMRFATRGDAMNFWRAPSKTRPTRMDGKPNRPLTALTISVEPL